MDTASEVEALARALRWRKMLETGAHSDPYFSTQQSKPADQRASIFSII